MKRAEREAIALERATSGVAMTNYPTIFAGFMAKGIPAEEIKPRENVLTYHAWRAVGRQVKRGEHGVKVLTYVEMSSRGSGRGETPEDGEDGQGGAVGANRGHRTLRPWQTTVFHVSQTEEAKG